MIRVGIIDDESKARSVLIKQLKCINEDIKVVGEADGVDTGYKMILERKPEIVFLDIEMNDGNGFQILERLGEIDFKVIFVTAYSEYAVKAFKFSALDYLLKPVEIDELRSCVDKCISSEVNVEGVQELVAYLKADIVEKKIIVKNANKIHLVKQKNIKYCNADGSYCEVIIVGDKPIIASMPLKEFEEQLDQEVFFRINKSCLVNKRHVRFYKRDSYEVELVSGERLDVSRRKRKEFVDFLSR